MRLAELQNVFQRYLLEGDETIAQYVAGSTRVPVRTRLAIYGEGYPLRLAEALEHSFPTLLQLMGAPEFAVLARSYIQRFPSVFRSIRYYGDQLAAFVSSEAPYAARPLLGEMARWEWAMANVFDAADATPIDTTALTQVDPGSWAELRFQWNPALEVVPLRWNVAALWKACSEGSATSAAPTPLERAGDWLLWRKKLQIYFRQLSATEAQALAAARAGESFGELCERLCAALDEQDASRHAAAFLRGWVESGLIIAVQVPQQGA